MQFKGLNFKKSTFFLLLATSIPLAQNLPTAKSIAAEMGMAWNIGNTMEAPGSPTSWGNPLPTQQLIDAVKAAGFNTVRIPCAWDTGHANHTTNEILPTWMAQVKQVVDYCIKDSLFVVLNIHWDGGWLEENISTAKQNDVKRNRVATGNRSLQHLGIMIVTFYLQVLTSLQFRIHSERHLALTVWRFLTPIIRCSSIRFEQPAVTMLHVP
jgi:hypothetical protein